MKRLILLLWLLTCAIGLYAKTISTNTTQSGTQTINESVTVNRGVTYTIEGDLTINGDFIAKGATIIINGTLHVTGNYENNTTTYRLTTYYSNTTVDGKLIVDKTITNNATITVNGKTEANEVIVNSESLIINSDAVLYSANDLTINKNGKVILVENSTTIVGGNLNQDGDTPLKLNLFAASTGSVDADHATLVVAGDYNIYSTIFGGTDNNAEYINPAENPNFYVFGSNDLNKISGITSTPKTESAFLEAYPMGLDGFTIIALPIELVYFEANIIGNEVSFRWQTATESNNNYFTIEQSLNGSDFETLATIAGNGTTSTIHNYSYSYRTNINVTTYYRLKQTDYNGNYSYSKIVAVAPIEKHISRQPEFTIYPNPATDYIAISGDYQSVIFVTASGTIIKEEPAEQQHNISNLPIGLNIVIINTANGRVSKTIFKR